MAFHECIPTGVDRKSGRVGCEATEGTSLCVTIGDDGAGFHFAALLIRFFYLKNLATQNVVGKIGKVVFLTYSRPLNPNLALVCLKKI